MGMERQLPVMPSSSGKPTFIQPRQRWSGPHPIKNSESYATVWNVSGTQIEMRFDDGVVFSTTTADLGSWRWRFVGGY